jgi:hypothetical protein
MRYAEKVILSLALECLTREYRLSSTTVVRRIPVDDILFGYNRKTHWLQLLRRNARDHPLRRHALRGDGFGLSPINTRAQNYWLIVLQS